jgi:hypothetical protein
MTTTKSASHPETGPYSGTSDRPDCPGKIVCPLTGDLICADLCPLEADARDVSLPVADTQPSCCAPR